MFPPRLVLLLPPDDDAGFWNSSAGIVPDIWGCCWGCCYGGVFGCYGVVSGVGLTVVISYCFCEGKI